MAFTGQLALLPRSGVMTSLALARGPTKRKGKRRVQVTLSLTPFSHTEPIRTKVFVELTTGIGPFGFVTLELHTLEMRPRYSKSKNQPRKPTQIAFFIPCKNWL